MGHSITEIENAISFEFHCIPQTKQSLNILSIKHHRIQNWKRWDCELEIWNSSLEVELGEQEDENKPIAGSIRSWDVREVGG